MTGCQTWGWPELGQQRFQSSPLDNFGKCEGKKFSAFQWVFILHQSKVILSLLSTIENFFFVFVTVGPQIKVQFLCSGPVSAVCGPQGKTTLTFLFWRITSGNCQINGFICGQGFNYSPDRTMKPDAWLVGGYRTTKLVAELKLENLILLKSLFEELRDYRLIMTHNPRRACWCGLSALKLRMGGLLEGWSLLPAARWGNGLTGFNHTLQPIQLCS